MENSNLYGSNNYSGVAIQGLKDSVYDVKDNYDDSIIIIEEDPTIEEEVNHNLINLNKVAYINTQVFEKADSLMKAGKSPILFGGDHSIAIGTVSATSANYENLGLIWIDAHADINSEDTTPTGNIHGMPIFFLMGEGNKKLSTIGGNKVKIKPENIVYLGLRSVDEGEVEIINRLNIKAYYYDEIEKRGLDTVLKETISYLSKCDNIHMSFDFDSMDPYVFPAVSTPVDKGFSIEDVYSIFDNILSTKKVRSIDLVEYNKYFDDQGKSLKFAMELMDFIKERY